MVVTWINGLPVSCKMPLELLPPRSAVFIVAHQAPLSMGILQARILEWVAMPSSRGSSLPGDQTQMSRIASRFFTCT